MELSSNSAHLSLRLIERNVLFQPRHYANEDWVASESDRV